MTVSLYIVDIHAFNVRSTNQQITMSVRIHVDYYQLHVYNYRSSGQYGVYRFAQARSINAVNDVSGRVHKHQLLG